jgi:nitrous oxidase accessory protein
MRWKRATAALATLWGVAGCGVARESLDPSWTRPIARSAPARPEGCRALPVGADLPAALADAREGDALCLAAGVWTGPIELTKRLTVWGPPEAIVRGGGQGTTVLITAPGTKVLGLTIDGSGGRFDTLDAGLKIHADDVTADGVLIKNATFGILVERANRVTISGCEVEGDPSSPHGLRGDGIRLWEVRDSTIRDNVVRNSRDVVIWYSSRNTVAGNLVAGGRYGSHFMYSHENVIEKNRFLGNVVGIFVMYSREIRVEKNLLADSGGAAGIGLGVKESGNLHVADNLFVHDTVGIYLDTSPLQLDDRNVFQRNEIRLGGAAIVFHSSPTRNQFTDNLFADNRVAVSVEGDGDALGATFEENDFDDYEGFDLDGDGVGDLPYELRMLSNQLTARHPELAFFRGTPALGLVDAVGRAVPLFAPKPIVRDPRPRMGGAGRGATRAN